MVEIRLAPLEETTEEILDPSVRLRVVRLLVLLPEKEFTGREIAVLLGVSHSNVQRAMRILVEDGFVMKRRIGASDVFRMNKDHFLYEPLRKLFTVGARLSNDITKELLSAIGKHAISIILFGSYARGTPDRRSDMDILVVTNQPEIISERKPRLESRFFWRYGIPLSLKVVSPSDLKRKPLPPYLQAVAREGLVISGRSLREVITPAK